MSPQASDDAEKRIAKLEERVTDLEAYVRAQLERDEEEYERQMEL